MLFLDGAYVGGAEGAARFRWVKAPTSAELAQLAHTFAHRVRRYLERQGLLERDAENRYLASDAVDEDPMNQLLGHSITYRIAVRPQAGRKVFTLYSMSGNRTEPAAPRNHAHVVFWPISQLTTAARERPFVQHSRHRLAAWER
jgi:hypothetical protein